MFLLKNKNVLLTGASGGIGKAIALHMINQGAKVVLTGTNEEKLQKLQGELGEGSTYIKSDLSNEDGLKNVSEKSDSFFGPIDILINNAGITSDNLFLRMKIDQWDNVLNINLNSSVKLTQHFLKGMITRPLSGV